MIFRTETGSVYEVDEEGKRMRRVEGLHDPGRFTRKEGKWRTYRDFLRPCIGTSAVFLWGDNVDAPDMAEPATITSRVIEIKQA